MFVGGHLDQSDDIGNPLETFKIDMRREVFEELGITLDSTLIGQPLVFYTPENLKASKHMLVAFPVVVECQFLTKFTDGVSEFIPIEKLGMIHTFDGWSKFIKKEFIDERERLFDAL